jgi:poly(ADP-ribose) glycohydrolase
MLLCEGMEANEAIQLIGFKKYHSNKGYSHTTSYQGSENYKYSYDSHRRAKEYITAIDAIQFPKKAFDQYKKEKVNREILKAYVGFKFEEEGVDKVVSGNWGCGAFGGDIKLKLLIQWIACSLAKV